MVFYLSLKTFWPTGPAAAILFGEAEAGMLGAFAPNRRCTFRVLVDLETCFGLNAPIEVSRQQD
jgi:hypothetical protein